MMMMLRFLLTKNITRTSSSSSKIVRRVPIQPPFVRTFHSIRYISQQQQQQQQQPQLHPQHEEYIAKSLHAKRLFDSGKQTDAIRYMNQQIESMENQLAFSSQEESNNLKGYIAAMHNNLGIIYQSDPQSAQLAVKHFKKSVELNPTDPAVYENLGALFADSMNRKDLAIPMLSRAVELEPEYVPCKHRLAKLYSDSTQTLDKAEQLLKECVKQEPTYYNAYPDLAMLLLSKRNPDIDKEALELIDQLIKTQEQEDSQIIGMSLQDLQDYQERRSRVDGWQLKGYALQRLHKFDEAARIFKRQIDQLSSDKTNSPIIKRRLSEYYLSYAIVLDQDHKKQEALVQAEKAFKIDPYNGNIVFTLAKLLEKNGRMDEAQHMLTEMLKVDPKNDAIYGALVNIYMEKGQKQVALKLLQNAIAKYPELKQTCGQYLQLLQKRNS
jgi:tetratricopeptide (TPR) repeat protein